MSYYAFFEGWLLLSQLPAEATKTGVTTEKQQNAELMTFALYSPDDRFDQTLILRP